MGRVFDYESRSKGVARAKPSKGRKRTEKSKRATKYEKSGTERIVDDVEFEGEDFQKPRDVDYGCPIQIQSTKSRGT
jgi:hypothetical protein